VSSFYTALRATLEERLGAQSSAVVDELPLTGDAGRSRVGAVPGEGEREAVVRTASPDYFAVMRIPLMAGRTFGAEDDAAASPRVVISASLARGLFGSSPAAGRRIRLGAGGRVADVIGVVGDVKHRSLDEVPLPTLYLSALQAPSPSSVIVARSPLGGGAVVETVRQEVRRLDPDVPVYRVRAMEDVVAASPGVPTRRVLSATFSIFAVLALVLSAIGLLGLAAQDVARRRKELALRMALGAEPGRILGSTLGRVAVTAGVGFVFGGALSLVVVEALDGLARSTATSVAMSAAGAAAVLLVTSVCAVLPAAVRAARTDPLEALREE
jgi:hypothetical protein